MRKASTLVQDFRLKRVRKASTFSRFQTKESEKGEHFQDFRLKKVRKASTLSRFQTKESEKGEHIFKISD